MTEFVTNVIQNSLSGFVAGALTTVGGYVGDAASGVGNLIDQRGQAVGDGITKKFDGWGQAVAAYGNSARTATAANNSQSSVVPDAKSKPAQKSIPSKGTKKALPGPDRKRFLPPALKNGTFVAKKGTYASSVAPYKMPGLSRSTAPSTVASAARTTKSTRPPLAKAKSDQSVPSTAKRAQTGPSKAKSVGGKVVPQKRSLPASKARGSSSLPKMKGQPVAGGEGPLGGLGGRGQSKTRGYEGL